MKRQIPKHLTEIIAIGVLSIVWFLIGWTARSWFQPSSAAIFEQARQALNQFYPNKALSDQELTYAAINGVLTATDDPYAQFLEPDVGRAYLTDFAGNLGVVGISPRKRNGQIVADLVFSGQAADRAGVKAGDIILSVNGTAFDVNTTEAQAAMLYLAGPVSSTARIVIQRGAETQAFDIVRQEKGQVTARLLDGNIAYLSLSAFTQNAPDKFKSALHEIMQQGAQALILDLRDNRGGSVEAAQQILSYFINEGVLFTAELKDEVRRPFMAQGGAFAANLPLTVLVNNESQSASEAAAAAIQDHQRGKIIGMQTHGKAEIQTSVTLGDGSVLHFSIAKILTPSNQWYEGRGIRPDIRVEDNRSGQTDAILDAAVKYVREKVLH